MATTAFNTKAERTKEEYNKLTDYQKKIAKMNSNELMAEWSRVTGDILRRAK